MTISYQYFNNNIILFNLTKQKLKVHSNVVSGKQTPFNYSFLELTGSKRDNIGFSNRPFEKKLNVFFISNFNMVTSP
jgi:hypothetical protein